MPVSFLPICLADLKTLIRAELEGSPFGGTIYLFRWWLLIDPALFSPFLSFLLITLLRPRPLYDFPLFFLQGQRGQLFFNAALFNGNYLVCIMMCLEINTATIPPPRQVCKKFAAKKG
jgi:hypothetical protein